MKPAHFAEEVISLMLALDDIEEKVSKKVKNALNVNMRIIESIHSFKDMYLVEKENLTKTIQELVEQLISLYSDDLRLFEVDLEIDLPKELKDTLVNSKLSFTFNNMMINSMEALTDAKNKFIKIKVEEDGDFISLQFIDNGCGVFEADYDKFMTRKFTTKFDGKHGGNSLSMAQQFLKRLQGSITHQRDGDLTIFTVRWKRDLVKSK